MIHFLEIFSLVTGLVYVWLQVRQSNWMWPVDILSCVAATIVFIDDSLWANAGLNIYYCLMAIWGAYSWIRDSKKVSGGELHLKKLTKGVFLASFGIGLIGGAGLIMVLHLVGDPAPYMEGLIGILGVLGTWWLAQSYLENWLLWLAADTLGVVLCLTEGLYWMSALYLIYVAAAVWGWTNWRKNGVII